MSFTLGGKGRRCAGRNGGASIGKGRLFLHLRRKETIRQLFVPDVEVNENADGDMMLKEILKFPTV